MDSSWLNSWTALHHLSLSLNHVLNFRWHWLSTWTYPTSQPPIHGSAHHSLSLSMCSALLHSSSVTFAAQSSHNTSFWQKTWTFPQTVTPLKYQKACTDISFPAQSSPLHWTWPIWGERRGSTLGCDSAQLPLCKFILQQFLLLRLMQILQWLQRSTIREWLWRAKLPPTGLCDPLRTPKDISFAQHSHTMPRRPPVSQREDND